MSETYVSNQKELLAALSKASGGDTILLEAGDYGSVEIDGLKFNDFVTIKSADGNMGAEFNTLDILSSSYIRVDNVKVARDSNSGTSVVLIDASNHIDFINSEVSGKVDTVYPITGPKMGIFVDNASSDITIENNYVHNVLNGITNFGTDDFKVIGNTVNYVGSDGFKFAGVDGGQIINNTGPTHFYATADAHEDFMQFQGPPSHNLEIIGNTLLLQNSFDMQGIFFGGQGGHSNLTIKQNIIYTQMANGIQIGEGDGSTITITDNTLINALDESRPATRISAPSGSTLENNIVSHRSGELDGNNLEIQHRDPNGDYYYDDLFVGLTDGKGITIEDLQPVPGSLAESYGAYDRLMELLNGDSGSLPERPAPEPTIEPTPEPTIEPDSGSSSDGNEALIEPLPNTVFAVQGSQEVSNAGDVIEVSHSQALELASATLAFTFNADTVVGRKGLVSKDASGDGHHFATYIQEGSLYIRFQDGETTERVQINGIQANTDYDVQVAVGEGGATVWLNGSIAGATSTNIDLSQNTEYLQVGGLGWASESGAEGFKNTFDGTISDLVLVEGLITPDELGAIVAGEGTSSDSGQDTPAADEPPVYPNSIFSMEGDNEFFGFINDIVNEEHRSAYEISEGTISFSFNADSVSGRQGLLSKDASGYSGGGDHFSAWISKGTLYVRFQDGEKDAIFTAENIKANQEYEITAYFEQGEVGMYLDGELVGTAALTMDWTDNTEYLQVGGLGWASNTGDDAVRHAFDGTISDVAIFDEVFTPQEVDLIV